MKRFLFILIAFMGVLSLNAQSYSTESNTKNTVASPDQNVNFRLFQTNNRWTYLKLDTRTGVITHIQYAVGEGDAMEYPLNPDPLVTGASAKPGRFFLYPTENTYNYILLDQVDGRCWQVQWNIDADKRMVVPIS